ncbi:hypothetical protein Bca4012_026625 [Brassica carinata]
MASLSPIDSFHGFDKEKLMRLAKLYPDDFSYVVKTAARNRIGDQFLSDCMVCFIEKELLESVSNEKVIQRFQMMNKRRVVL